MRLVLVGEPRTWCASPAFRWLGEHCGRSAGELPAPGHLPAPDREVLADELDTLAVLQHVEASGALRRIEPGDELVRSVARAWTAREAAEPGASQLAIGSSPAQVAELNAAIQSARAAAGRLGKGERFDVVRPGAADPEGRAPAPAVSRNPGALESIRVHVGDRLRILENEPRSGLARGDVGTVLAVSRRRIRLLVDGREHSFHPRRHNRFTLGYAATVHQQTGTADHVHAILSAGSSRPGVFRAATSHEKTLTVHWAARAGETVTDLASAIDAKAAVECTQHYADRQRALHDAHLSAGAANELRSAWHSLSGDERKAMEDEDRRHRARIHEHQRPRDRANPWLRTAEPGSIAAAIGHAVRYPAESAAALAYHHRHGELTGELAATEVAGELAAPPAAPDTRRLELLEALHELATSATGRAARSSTFRLALTEKTPFTPEDLDRHLAECEHELRTERLKEQAHDSQAHFEAHARAWRLDAARVLAEGRDLAARAKLDGARLWLDEGYGEWHRSLAELATRREALDEARAAIDTSGLAAVLEDFKAESAKVDAALGYHEREEKRAARDVEALKAAIKDHEQADMAWMDSLYTDDRRLHEETAEKCSALGRQLNRQARRFVGRYARYEPWLQGAGIDLESLQGYARAHNKPSHRSAERRPRKEKHAVGDVEALKAAIEDYERAFKELREGFYAKDSGVAEEAAEKCAALSEALGRRARYFVGELARHETRLREAGVDLESLKGYARMYSDEFSHSRSRQQKLDQGFGMS